jgi:hypothetical protein
LTRGELIRDGRSGGAPRRDQARRGAGEMSRPILERLGFSIVGWCDTLLDPLD